MTRPVLAQSTLKEKTHTELEDQFGELCIALENSPKTAHVASWHIIKKEGMKSFVQ